MNVDLTKIIVSEITQIVNINLTKDTVRNFTCRPSAGLLLATKGSVQYCHDNSCYLSEEGQALFISQGITYSLKSLTDSNTYVINFRTTTPIENMGIACYPMNVSNLLNILKRMENNWFFKKTSYQPRCFAGLYEIFSILNDRFYATYQPSDKAAIISPSIGYIESHYADSNITNDMLAAISGISTIYFRKLFVQKYGVPPMKYITLKRIEKAKDLLSSQYFSSISEVAAATGFSSIYHFDKVFKNLTSYTPSEYSRICQQALVSDTINMQP